MNPMIVAYHVYTFCAEQAADGAARRADRLVLIMDDLGLRVADLDTAILRAVLPALPETWNEPEVYVLNDPAWARVINGISVVSGSPTTRIGGGK